MNKIICPNNHNNTYHIKNIIISDELISIWYCSKCEKEFSLQ